MAVAAPKTHRRKLSEQARRDGVSLNTLAVTLLAEGPGAKVSHEG